MILKKCRPASSRLWVAMLGLLIVQVCTISSCRRCQDISCFTPPASFNFQLHDKNSGIDLIKNGTYMLEEIALVALADEARLSLQIDTTTADHVTFICQEIGWREGEAQKNYRLQLSDDEQFDFIYLSLKVEENCCTYYKREMIDFDTVTTEWRTKLDLLFIKL